MAQYPHDMQSCIPPDWCQNTLSSALKLQRELSGQWSNKWRCSIYYEMLVSAPRLLDRPSLRQTQTVVFTMVSETVTRRQAVWKSISVSLGPSGKTWSFPLTIKVDSQLSEICINLKKMWHSKYLTLEKRLSIFLK